MVSKFIKEKYNTIYFFSEKMMNLNKFRKLLESKESLEELQNKITFLNTQLSIRDDEIKHVLNFLL